MSLAPHPKHKPTGRITISPANDADGLARLKELQPEHASIKPWLKEFRNLSPENKQIFERVFSGNDGHIDCKNGVNKDDIAAILSFFEAAIEKGVSGEQKFSDGVLASLLENISPHLKILGHQYDDLIRVIKYALTGNAEIMYSASHDNSAKAHEFEESTGLHIHSGKPMAEVGAVLAVTLATAAIAEGTADKLPWAAQVALKSAGVWPLFNYMIRGELNHAMAHVKEGKNLQDAVKYGLVTAIAGMAILKKGGGHELAAAAIMPAILSMVGEIQTDAVERGMKVMQSMIDALPQTAGVICQEHNHTSEDGRLDETETGDHHVHDTKIAEIKRGDRIKLSPGGIVPVDVVISKIDNGKETIKIDTYLASGQQVQIYGVGDKIPQGSIIADDIGIEAEVENPFNQSLLVRQVEEQKKFKPSKRQSRARDFGDKWVWGTIAGTVLVVIANIVKPLLKGVGVDFNHVLERATSFATLASPCSILAAPMIESTTVRALAGNKSIFPLNGRGITEAQDMSAYALDFTGTCSFGAKFEQLSFYGADGHKIEDGEARELAERVTAAGIKAGSQHLKQKALRREFSNASAKAAFITDASDDLGRGVAAKCGIDQIRIGKLDYVLQGIEISPQQKQVLEAYNSEGLSLTYMRYGDKVGIANFSNEMRPGVKETIARLGASNCHILTGDNNREYILGETRKLGIPDDNVFTNLEVASKAEKIAELQQKGHKVAMIGDGHNDHEALAKADVRFVMNDTAHPAAIAVADFTISGLEDLVPIKEISRKVNRVSLGTLIFSTVYTLATALAEATGLIKLPVIAAAIGHEGVSGAIAFWHSNLAKSFADEFKRSRDGIIKSLATSQLQENQVPLPS